MSRTWEDGGRWSGQLDPGARKGRAPARPPGGGAGGRRSAPGGADRRAAQHRLPSVANHGSSSSSSLNPAGNVPARPGALPARKHRPRPLHDERQAAFPVRSASTRRPATVFLCIRRDRGGVHRADRRPLGQSMALRLGLAAAPRRGGAPRAPRLRAASSGTRTSPGSPLTARTPHTPTGSSSSSPRSRRSAESGTRSATRTSCSAWPPWARRSSTTAASRTRPLDERPPPHDPGRECRRSRELIAEGASRSPRALGFAAGHGAGRGLRLGMAVRLGVDTLCWHLRLETGGSRWRMSWRRPPGSAPRCSGEPPSSAHARDPEALEALAVRAQELGLQLLASGDFLGRGRGGRRARPGRRPHLACLARARALGSPLLRVVSGFYRADPGRPARADRRRAPLRCRRPARSRARRPSRWRPGSCSRTTPTSPSRSTKRSWRRRGTGMRAPTSSSTSSTRSRPSRIPPSWSSAWRRSHAGHVKDYVFRSIPTDDGYHRHGRGGLPLSGARRGRSPGLLEQLRRGIGELRLLPDRRGASTTEPRSRTSRSASSRVSTAPAVARVKAVVFTEAEETRSCRSRSAPIHAPAARRSWSR